MRDHTCEEITCPHCSYKSGGLDRYRDTVRGEEGHFYALPLKLTQPRELRVDETTLFACPRCHKTFIDG